MNTNSSPPANDRSQSNRPSVAPGLPLQTKLTLSFAVVALIVAAIVTVAIYINVRLQLRRDIGDRLRDAVAIGALQVDGDLHATLLDPSQEDGPEYTQLKQVFQGVRDAGSGYRYVYSLRMVNNQAIFIVDAETDPEFISHLGDVYEDLQPSTLALLNRLTEPEVELELYTDEWGTWMTGYAPIYTSDGRVDAVFCIDISAENVLQHERQILGIAAIIYIVIIFVVVFLAWILAATLTRPINTLIEGAQRITAGDLAYTVVVQTRDEFALLATAFNSMSTRLRQDLLSLETRVADRTREMEQRSTYLRAASDVGYTVTSILNADRLVQQVVDLIRERFGLYYVGLFLVDEANEWAVLRAGTGDAGKKMLASGHRIKIGEGMIGWAVLNSQARVAMEVDQDAVRLATSDLPETRSEAALPLRSRSRVIGALTVQSTRPGIFDPEFVALLQTMADQVAVALDNARLFTESEEAIHALRRSYGELSRQAWVETIRGRRTAGYTGNASGIHPLHAQPLSDRSLSDRPLVTPAPAGEERTTLALPIKVRDQLLGVIEARKPSQAGQWTKDEQTLMETLVDQLGVALENARLYEDTQQRAVQERLLSDITAKVRASTDVNVILQTAMQELAAALRVPRGAIQLRPMQLEASQAAQPLAQPAAQPQAQPDAQRAAQQAAQPLEQTNETASPDAPSALQGDDAHA